PDSGSELADAGWPGPLAGTTLTAATAWEGAFVPVYYFAGYAYGETEIAIQGRRGEPLAQVSDAVGTASGFRASRCGVLGVGREGIRVCPDQGVSQEVLVWFAPGGLALPAGTTHATREAASYSSPGIDSLLAASGVRHVARTHPAAVRDTTGFPTGSGRRAYRTDLTSRFTFVAAGASQVESLAEALGADPSVLRAVRNGVVLESLVFPDEFEHDPSMRRATEM
ncbi:MAG: hypothetical protein FJY75_13955, partial [Candidatus Eisenbacteria bacterium]|nr:hypothetical protein [Candidatus Eisenbacteria bacterium]